jgi:predicted outer membrane repeat protein
MYNSALNGFGGSLAFGENSTAVVADSAFSSCSAKDGGALISTSSMLTLRNSHFHSNTANSSGGALWGYGFIADNCTFEYNTALFGGGAVLVGDRAQLSQSLESSNSSFTEVSSCSIYFSYHVPSTSLARAGSLHSVAVGYNGLHRHATTDHLLLNVYAWMYCGVALYCACILLQCTFKKNNGSSGGAISYSGPQLSVTACSFIDNTAASTDSSSSSGGGISGDGNMTITDSQFFNNTASRGGAVIMLGNLTAVASVFEGNRAVDNTGGAVVVVRGSSSFSGCTFTANTAKTFGGAIQSATKEDSATISTCKFVGNTAGIAGGSIFGYTQSVPQVATTNTFSNSIASCCHATGYGASGNLTVDTTCADTDTSSKAGDECCKAGFYSDGERCQICTAQLGCDIIGTNTATLQLQAGLWRPDLTTLTAYECYYADACKGGMASTSSQDYCATGYTGPYCAVCAKDYTQSIGYSCIKCSQDTAAAYSIITLVILVLLAIAAYIIYELCGIGDVTDASQAFKEHGSSIVRILKCIPWSQLRTPVVVFQILTQFINITGLKLPSLYQTFLSWMNLMNIDLGWTLSLGCAVKFNFYQLLLFKTLAPFAVMIVLAITYRIALHKATQVQAVARSKHFTALLTLSFLTYSTTSAAVFSTFACDDIEGTGKSYLRADYSIQCGTATHTSYIVYAAFMMLVYPIGIPVLYTYLLRRHRGHLTRSAAATAAAAVNAQDSRTDKADLKSTKFLWQAYKPQYYYWEVTECIRRVLLTGLVVFIYPNSAAQPVIACIMAAISLFVALRFQPHIDSWDGNIYTTGGIVILLSIYLTLLLKVDVSKEQSEDKDLFSMLLIALNIVILVAAASQLYLMGKRTYRKQLNSRSAAIHSAGVNVNGISIHNMATLEQQEEAHWQADPNSNSNDNDDHHHHEPRNTAAPQA